MNGNRVLFTAATAALAPAIWGSTYLVTTELLPPERPLLAAAGRALPAGLALLALGRKLPKGVWWWRALALGVLNVGAFSVLLFIAAYRLPGGVAALLASIQPMMVLILAALVLKDRIRPVHVLACLVGVGGVGLLVLRSTAHLDLIGILAALGAALCMASGTILVKRWKPPVGVLVFTGWQLTAGGLVLLPLMFGFEGLPGHLTGSNLIGFAYLGGVGMVFGYAVWFRGVQRLPALAVSFLLLVSPVIASVLGYVFLHQTLAPAQLAGAAIIVGAIVLAQLTPTRHPATQPPAVSKEPARV